MSKTWPYLSRPLRASRGEKGEEEEREGKILSLQHHQPARPPRFLPILLLRHPSAHRLPLCPSSSSLSLRPPTLYLTPSLVTSPPPSPHRCTPPRLSLGFVLFFSLFMRAPTPARCYLPLSAASLRSNGSIWCIWQTSGITCHPVVVALAAARLAGRRRRRSCLDSNSVGSLLVGS